MQLGLSFPVFTAIHIAISLAGIGAGFVAIGAMLAGRWLPVWTALFLLTTALTSITGFLFPMPPLTPAQGTGIVALIVMAVALFALYGRGLDGRWRTIYAVAAVASLYLNCFVAVVQTFQKQPTLIELAPGQSGPAFLIGQLLLLGAFLVIGWMTVSRFRTAG